MKSLFNNLVVNDNAKQAQMQTVKYLESLGYYCIIEYHVKDRGDGTPGRIDIIAKNNHHKLAIEFDNITPRTKSLFKLKAFDADYKYVLLRGGNKSYYSGNVLVQSVKCLK